MNRRARLAELVTVFGTLGFIGFGGPAAHIALMRRELVEIVAVAVVALARAALTAPLRIGGALLLWVRVPSVLLVALGAAIGSGARAVGVGA